MDITYNFGQICCDKIENLFFREKTTLPQNPQMFFGKFWAFGKKTWPDSTLILVGEGENLRIEKRSHFLNLLDLQILSQQVFTRVVVKFLKYKRW